MKLKIMLLFVYVSTILSFCYAQQKEMLYVGTFSFRDSKGIYVFDFDRTTQRLTLLQTVADGVSPSFLEIHPTQKVLYAVYRKGNPKQENTGSIVAYQIDVTTGLLTKINQQPTHGEDPCHVSIDPKGRFAYVSNYKKGNVVCYLLNADGSLKDASDSIQHYGRSIVPLRQEIPHTHSAIPAPNGRDIYVSDLGIDKIMHYQINPDNGKLRVARQPFVQTVAGAGPRHFTIHSNQKWAYSLEEISSTISVYQILHPSGSLRAMQRIRILPEPYSAPSKAADIHITANGQWLYASNRGHDKLGIFKINAQTGQLIRVGFEDSRGKDPRNFCIDQKNEFIFVVNQNSDNLLIFKLNQSTGKLEFANQEIKIPAAVCIKQLFLK